MRWFVPCLVGFLLAGCEEPHSTPELDCVDYSAGATPPVVDHIDGPAFHLAVFTPDAPARGTFLVTADRSGAVRLIQLGRDGTLDEVGSAPLSIGYTNSLFIDGDLAYASSLGGVEVFDIGDPRKPRSVAVLPARQLLLRRGDIALTHVDEDRAFLGIRVMNISDPLNPEVLRSVPVHSSTGPNMAVFEDWGYWRVGTELWIFDVSSLADVEHVGTMSLSITGDVRVHDGHLMGIVHSDELRNFTVADLSDPLNPQVVASLPLGKRYYKLEISDDVAYAFHGGAYAEDHSTVTVIDVRDPANPSVVAALEFDEFPLAVVPGSHALYSAVANERRSQVVSVPLPCR